MDSLDILNECANDQSDTIAEHISESVPEPHKPEPQTKTEEISLDLDGGTSIECTMLDGKIDGICKIFKNGSCIAEISYIEGVKNGTCRFYQDDALFAEIEYKDDKKNGVAQYYNSAGGVQKTENFVNDLKNGPSCTYYDNGAVFEQCEYENDKIKGKAVRFDLKGKEME